LLQLAAFRPPVRTGIKQLDSPVVDGLHFVGASTRPGNGVPLVLMGVKVVAEQIMKEAA
jgi:phytoene desaturase (3,4-didehydrolycopene-forming)